MYKKAISVLLVITMLLTSVSVSFADPGLESSNGSKNWINTKEDIMEISGLSFISDDLEETIMDEVSIMEYAGLTGYDLTGVELLSDGDVEYTLEYMDVVTKVKVQRLFDGTVELNYVEGEKENTVRITPDNGFYVDGHKMDMDFAGAVFSESQMSEDEMLPRAGFTYSVSKTCPYGSINDYTHPHGGTKYKEFNLNDQLCEFTVALLANIIMSYYMSSLGIMAELVPDMAIESARTLIRSATGMDQYTRYLSCAVNTYYHNSTQSYTINNTLKVKRHRVIWYYNSDYTNYAGTENWYEYGIWG